MRVLHIIHRYPPAVGGSEKWCGDLCRYLAKKGIITEVATINLRIMEAFFKWLPDERYSLFGPYDFDEGVFIRRYRLWSFAFTTLSVKMVCFLLYVMGLEHTEIGDVFQHSPHSFELYLKLASEIKKADVVHLHTLPFFHNIVGFVLAKFLRKTVVITPHFHPGHEHYEKKMFYDIMKRCDAVIAVSGFEKSYLAAKGIPESKIFITANSIDREIHITQEETESYKNKLMRANNISENAKKIIFLGNKQKSKGIVHVIEAAFELAKEVEEQICLFLVGPSNQEFPGIDSFLDRPVNLRIIDFGIVPEKDKEHLLQISDVLVLPSKFEAFGIVFLEAWKFRKPVIGSDRGPIPDLIKNAGLQVRYGDVKDIKEKMKRILFDSKLAKEFGEAGWQKLNREFSIESIGRVVLSTYHKKRKSKKRVLLVANAFPPHGGVSGSGIVAYHQGRFLKNMGFDVTVFTGSRNARMEHYRVIREKRPFETLRINLHDIDFDYNFVDYQKGPVKAEFKKFVYDVAPDIIHFHNAYALGPSIIEVCRDMRIPSVVTLHDYNFICYKNILVTDNQVVCKKKDLVCRDCFERPFNGEDFIINLAERNNFYMQYLHLPQLVISPSRYLIERFITCGLPPEKCAVINNGIDLSRFNHAKKSVSRKIRFSYIGQLIDHKGVDRLLHSVSLLRREERRKMSLLIVGFGDKLYVGFCRKLAREIGISDTVTFAGEVDNRYIPKILNRTDFLIVPSLWPENSPVTIMEALASGTPVLASDIGGIPELIKDGVNGYLHAYYDTAALAENIRKVIEQPEAVKKMKQACIAKAQEYEMSKQVREIARHYYELIENALRNYD